LRRNYDEGEEGIDLDSGGLMMWKKIKENQTMGNQSVG
jgi:hypothetical protein